jgi:hypothetical protein
MLEQALRFLFDSLGLDPEAESSIVELSETMFGRDGRPAISRPDLIPCGQYAERYNKILESGFAWVNLSYVGDLDGRPVVTVELPLESRGSSRTSVNYSGPPRAVEEAGMDATVYLKLSD